RRLALVEEEERLELRACLAEEPQTPFLWPPVRAFVREDHAVLVRLDPQSRDEPLAGARDAVRPHVVLREPPESRLVVFRQDALGAPIGPEPARILLVVGERQVHDVVRTAGPELVALLARDHVVGGS